jgi:hypothetical protein
VSTTIYPDHRQAVKDLLDEGVSPGKLIPHDWIDDHLRLDNKAHDYPFKRMSGLEAFKEELLVYHKIHLQNVRGKGYVIIAPENQTKVAVDEAMHGVGKSIAKGMMRLTNVDAERLTDDGRKENADALSRMAALGGMTKKQLA